MANRTSTFPIRRGRGYNGPVVSRQGVSRMAVELTAEQRTRAHESEDFWLATTRATGGPHLVPIWAVLVGDHFYIGTEPGSQKVRNLLAGPRAALALPDTRAVLIVEGEATILREAPPGVMERFKEKYDWTFDPAGDAWLLVQIVPDRILSWNS